MRSNATANSFSFASLVRPIIQGDLVTATHDNIFIQPVNYSLFAPWQFLTGVGVAAGATTGRILRHGFRTSLTLSLDRRPQAAARSQPRCCRVHAAFRLRRSLDIREQYQATPLRMGAEDSRFAKSPP